MNYLKPKNNKSVKIRREMKNEASGQMEMKIDTNKEPIEWGKRKRERERERERERSRLNEGIRKWN